MRAVFQKNCDCDTDLMIPADFSRAPITDEELSKVKVPYYLFGPLCALCGKRSKFTKLEEN